MRCFLTKKGGYFMLPHYSVSIGPKTNPSIHHNVRWGYMKYLLKERDKTKTDEIKDKETKTKTEKTKARQRQRQRQRQRHRR